MLASRLVFYVLDFDILQARNNIFYNVYGTLFNYLITNFFLKRSQVLY